MPVPWNNATKRGGKLHVYFDPALSKTVWNGVIESCLKEFNLLSRNNRLGVTLEKSKDAPVKGGGGADVNVTTGNGKIDFEYDGEKDSTTLIGISMHGRTFLPQRNGTIEKAYVYLPATPLISTPQGPRPVGPAIMKLIAVHEFVHCSGLLNSDHNGEDLFQASPSVDYGSSAAHDRAKGQRAGKATWMPPLFLSASTVRTIADNWA